MIPTNDILSTLTMIQMSGGGTYTNENKTITENGIYKPDDDVRWDKVSVGVPGLYSELFENMPTFWGSEIIGDGWYVLLKLDDSGSLKKDGWFYDRDCITEDGVNRTVFYRKTWTPFLYLAMYYQGKFIYSVNSPDNLGGNNQWLKYIPSDHTSITDFYIFEGDHTLLGIENPSLTFASSASTILQFSCKANVKYHSVYRDGDTGEIRDESENTNSRNIYLPFYIDGRYSLTDLSDGEFEQKLGDFIESVKKYYFE